MRRAMEIGLDIVGVVGVGSVIYGAWLVYVPAGYLIAGAMMIAIAVLVPGRMS